MQSQKVIQRSQRQQDYHISTQKHLLLLVNREWGRLPAASGLLERLFDLAILFELLDLRLRPGRRTRRLMRKRVF